MTLRLALPFLAAVLGACAVAPSDSGTGDDGTGDDGSGTGSGSGSGSAEDPGSMMPPACQDDVPVADIVPLLENSSATIGDVARGPDGALYFITDMTTTAGAKIARRLPCGDIEKDWLVTTTPIEHIEISTDNVLYMVANGTSTAKRSRMWLVDLAVAGDLPHLLFDEPGTQIQSMSAGQNGKVFFMGGDVVDDVELMSIDSSANPQVIEAFPGKKGYVAGMPNGGARFYYERLDPAYGQEHNIGSLQYNTNGTTVTSEQNIVTGQPNDYDIRDIQADASGGIYIKRVQGSLAGTRTCTLYHAPDLISTRTVVAEVKNVTDCRIIYGIDGDASSAHVVAYGGTKLMTAVTLPVPLMML